MVGEKASSAKKNPPIYALPDLTINPGRMPPFHQKWGCDHVWSCKMDRMGGVGSPLAGFWMGLGERPPHQPFPVLFDRLVWSKIRTFNSYVGHGMFLSAPAKKTLRKMRNDHGGRQNGAVTMICSIVRSYKDEILFNSVMLTIGKSLVG